MSTFMCVAGAEPTFLLLAASRQQDLSLCSGERPSSNGTPLLGNIFRAVFGSGPDRLERGVLLLVQDYLIDQLD